MAFRGSVVVAGLAVALAAAWMAWSPQPGAASAVVLAPAGMPRHGAPPGAAPALGAPPRLALAAEAAETGPVFDQRDLFALFEKALASDDPAVMAQGIAAWRACSAYYGLWNLDHWLQKSIPAGLGPTEHARRERHGRASAQRCAGFAEQTRLWERAEALTERARAAGDAQERLREALLQQGQTPDAGHQAVAELACTVVRQQAERPDALRWLGPVLRQTAFRQPGHLLNAGSPQVRSLAITLALCDLHPQGCDAHAELPLRSCMGKGICHYTQVQDYWQDAAPADVQAAQPLRAILVEKLRQGDCATLFD